MANRLVRLVAMIGLGVTAACGTPEPAAPAGDGAITVVASTDVWASVASAVGGREVAVKAIVSDPSGDPHSYQVSPKDAAELRGARLVVFNGGGYDDFVEQALDEGGGPLRIKAVDLQPQARAAHERNEHVWYDLPTVVAVADEIARQLGELRPSAKAAFDANADAFGAKLDAMERSLDELATKHDGTPVAATEPVAHYLLEAAGLTEVTPDEFTEAIEEETDPPAGAVAEIQAMVAERRVALIVHNPQTETPVITDLLGRARAVGLPVVDMTETLPIGQDYVTWMSNQIQALSEALTKT